MNWAFAIICIFALGLTATALVVLTAIYNVAGMAREAIREYAGGWVERIDRQTHRRKI